jgi:hypothetical protein
MLDNPKVYRWKIISKCEPESTTVTIEDPNWIKQDLIYIPRIGDLLNWAPSPTLPTPLEQRTVKGSKKITVECKDENGKQFKYTYSINESDNWTSYLDRQPENSIVNFQSRITDFDWHPKEIMMDWIFSYGMVTPNNLFKEYDPDNTTICSYYPKLLEEHKLKDLKAAYFIVCDKGGVNIIAVAWDIWQK